VSCDRFPAAAAGDPLQMAMLLQTEKLAAIGQLAAGVAHEINNPIGFVHSNLGSLDHYVGDLLRILDAYERATGAGAAGSLSEVDALRRRLDLDFLRADVRTLLAETREGIARVRRIVQDLKDLARPGAEDEWQWADLHRGIESTLNIVGNELRYKARIVREYGILPEIECLPVQINQVIMNLLVNAAHAIEREGIITVRTGADASSVWVEIADNGAGISPEHLPLIFEPFFTTKPSGRGTGLGLALARDIVRKHSGRIEVESEVGRGTAFRVTLPRTRTARSANEGNAT
jgi:signal transduction histidine kinase